jgi:hypothetical protein
MIFRGRYHQRLARIKLLPAPLYGRDFFRQGNAIPDSR